jgi:hypothetical protein
MAAWRRGIDLSRNVLILDGLHIDAGCREFVRHISRSCSHTRLGNHARRPVFVVPNGVDAPGLQAAVTYALHRFRSALASATVIGTSVLAPRSAALISPNTFVSVGGSSRALVRRS